MFCWQITIQFDPSILHIVDVAEGDFLQQGGTNSTFFIPFPDEPTINIRYPRRASAETTSRITFGCTIGTTYNTPAIGNGCLATMRLRVRGLGSTKIEVDMLSSPSGMESYWLLPSGAEASFQPVYNALYNP